MLCDMKDTDATLGGEGFELAAGVPNICLAHVNVYPDHPCVLSYRSTFI